MDKRYQVFLSSTFIDLVDERKLVMSALQKAGFFVAGMELFPSDDDESWEVIKRVIDQSDYYVLVIAGRYGTIGEEGKSFTEMEYDYAREKKLPVLAFLHEDPSNLPVKHVESANPEKLKAFKAKIGDKHNRRSWISKDGLATEVLASMSQATNLRPRTGWVRGGIADTNVELTNKLEALRGKHDELQIERDRLAERLTRFNISPHDQGIAWGEDEAELAVEFKNGDNGPNETTICTTQWNRIFDLVSPRLIGWCKAYDAVHDLESVLNDEALRHADENVTLKEFKLTTESLVKIRNQLIALKLIAVDFHQPENRGRFISKPIELWRLSEEGLSEHTQKVAERQPGKGKGNGDSAN